MPKLTAVTCTYNRPEAIALCAQYIKRQVRPPDQWLILDGAEPMPAKILRAIREDKIEGEYVAFVEDDDYYDSRWLYWAEEKLNLGFDIVGQGHALYYNVRQRWYSNCLNTRHASLCQTVIHRRLLPALAQLIPAFDNPFFDTRLWRLNGNRYLHIPKPDVPGWRNQRLVIGIKAMYGGYSAEHSQDYPALAEMDPDMDYLRSLIGKDAEAYAKYHVVDPEIAQLAGVTC
jgi:hypothetical protein